MTTNTHSASFNIGQVIQHRNFNYRGVIVDVDASFQGTDEWYKENARSYPPKDSPWYHILVDDENVVTYVAEKNIEVDDESVPIEHPMVDEIFSGYDSGKYNLRVTIN